MVDPIRKHRVKLRKNVVEGKKKEEDDEKRRKFRREVAKVGVDQAYDGEHNKEFKKGLERGYDKLGDDLTITGPEPLLKKVRKNVGLLIREIRSAEYFGEDASDENRGYREGVLRKLNENPRYVKYERAIREESGESSLEKKSLGVVLAVFSLGALFLLSSNMTGYSVFGGEVVNSNNLGIIFLIAGLVCFYFFKKA